MKKNIKILAFIGCTLFFAFQLNAKDDFDSIEPISFGHDAMKFKEPAFQIDCFFLNSKEYKSLNIRKKDFDAFFPVWYFFRYNTPLITPDEGRRNRYLYFKLIDTAYITVVKTNLSIILNGQLINGRKSKRKILCPLQIGKEIPIKYFEKISKEEAYIRYGMKVNKRGAIVIETDNIQ